MNYKKHTEEIVDKILKIAKAEDKLTGFCIGNTAKRNSDNLYFTPIRNTSIMVVAGVIVYSEQQAINIAKIIDGKVQYILVDAEKKIPNKEALSGELSNVERVVRETVLRSTIWVYKGNDLSVEAVDGLLTQLTKNFVRGIGGKKITILGAGNIGSKLALKLVERGAYVVITRRNKQVLNIITKSLNYIKPIYTQASIVGMTNNQKAAEGAEILIGTSRGNPVITSEIVKELAPSAIIVDVGKGVIYPDAVKTAAKLGISIFRLDVSAAFEGLIHNLWATENKLEKKFGRRKLYRESIVSGGLLGQKNEIVVDNIWNPSLVYGIADGKGDFIRELTRKQIMRINKLQRMFEVDIAEKQDA